MLPFVNVLVEGPSTGVAGCGMRVKIETGHWVREISMEGCRIKILRREQDLLMLTRGLYVGKCNSKGLYVLDSFSSCVSARQQRNCLISYREGLGTSL